MCTKKSVSLVFQGITVFGQLCSILGFCVAVVACSVLVWFGPTLRLPIPFRPTKNAAAALQLISIISGIASRRSPLGFSLCLQFWSLSSLRSLGQYPRRGLGQGLSRNLRLSLSLTLTDWQLIIGGINSPFAASPVGV